MNIDSDVYDALVDIAGEGKVFALRMPLRAKGETAPLPSIVYQRIDRQTMRSHGGDELVGPTYQFTCWSNSILEARGIAREVSAYWAARIGEAFVENEIDHWDPEEKLFARIVDVRIWRLSEEEAS